MLHRSMKLGKVTQDYRTVLKDLRTTNLWGAQYALSDNGTLLYSLGGATDEGKLVKIDRRSGAAQDLGFPPGIYQHVSMARDGVHVAASMKEGGRMNVFTADLRRPFADQFMAVPVPALTDSWIPKPQLMFRDIYLNVQHRPWDVIDDQHFIMLQPTHPDQPGTELYLVQNWFEEIKRLLPNK